MKRRLFVSNLSYDMDAAAARDLLTDLFGLGRKAVREVKMISDRETGTFRGFGFIEMMSDIDATVALRLFDGFDVGGRPMRVREAEERQRG